MINHDQPWSNQERWWLSDQSSPQNVAPVGHPTIRQCPSAPNAPAQVRLLVNGWFVMVNGEWWFMMVNGCFVMVNGEWWFMMVNGELMTVNGEWWFMMVNGELMTVNGEWWSMMVNGELMTLNGEWWWMMLNDLTIFNLVSANFPGDV